MAKTTTKLPPGVSWDDEALPSGVAWDDSSSASDATPPHPQPPQNPGLMPASVRGRSGSIPYSPGMARAYSGMVGSLPVLAAGTNPLAVGTATGVGMAITNAMNRAAGLGAPTPKQELGPDAAWSAIMAGGQFAANNVLGPMFGPIAGSLARAAFPKNMSVDYLKNFGEVIPRPWETGLKNPKLPVANEAGIESAKASALASSAKAKAMEEAVGPITAQDVIDHLDSKIAYTKKVAPSSEDYRNLVSFKNDFLRGNVEDLPKPSNLVDRYGEPYPVPEPDPRSLEMPGETKRYSARLARAGYRNTDTGAAAAASNSANVEANKAIAKGIREELALRAPGLAEQNQKTQAFKAWQAAITEAYRARPTAPPWAHASNIGTGIAGSLAATAFGHPQMGMAAFIPEAAMIGGSMARDPALLLGLSRGLQNASAANAPRAAFGLGNTLYNGFAPPDSTR